jgi:hypothetical protein
MCCKGQACVSRPMVLDRPHCGPGPLALTSMEDSRPCEHCHSDHGEGQANVVQREREKRHVGRFLHGSKLLTVKSQASS